MMLIELPDEWLAAEGPDQLAVSVVPVIQDNYVWIIHSRTDYQRVYIVDPGEAAPVIEAIERHQWQPQAILNTHRHWDHVTGIEALVQRYQLPVYAPAGETIPCETDKLAEGDEIAFEQDQLRFKILDIFGHTEGHIAYLTDMPDLKVQAVFSGDTLFSLGCGRLLGGTAEQLHQSLQKLRHLPASTIVYCTHEYTLANIAFAKAVGFKTDQVNAFEAWCQSQRQAEKPTVPTTIAREAALNPFLNTDQKQIAAAVQADHREPQQVFTQLRQWKDRF